MICDSGATLPPELQDSVQRGLHIPSEAQPTDAETAGIASIHPESRDDSRGQTMLLAERGPSDQGSTQKPSLYESLMRRRIDAQTKSETKCQSEEKESPGQFSLADSLRDQNGSGHLDIQNLAEHYKGRSRCELCLIRKQDLRIVYNWLHQDLHYSVSVLMQETGCSSRA